MKLQNPTHLISDRIAGRLGWVSRVAFHAMATIIIVTVLSPAALATFPGINGHIAYSLGGTEAGIYVTDVGRIYPNSGAQQAGEPAWSPNGSKVAFIRFDFPHNLFVMDANGDNVRQVASAAQFGGMVLFSPAWDPSGQKISFVVGGGSISGYQIWTVTLGIAGATPTFQDPIVSPGLNWSRSSSDYPQGRLVFRCRFRWSGIGNPNDPHNLMSDLCVYTPSDDPTFPGVVLQLPIDYQDYHDVGSPKWSPDGKKIIFAMSHTVPVSGNEPGGGPRGGFAEHQIFSVNANGSGVTQLTSTTVPNTDNCPDDTDLGLFLFGGAPSPDGSSIVVRGHHGRMDNNNGFCSISGTQAGLYIVSASGGTPVPLLADPPGTAITGPDWQPVVGDLTVNIDDAHTNELEGLKVELCSQAGCPPDGTLIDDHPVNVVGTGDYIFAHVPPGDYKIRVTLVDHTGGAFDIRHADTPDNAVWAEYSHTQDGSGLPDYEDIHFENSPDLVRSNAPFNALEKLDDMANIYFRMRQFVDWVKANLMLDTGPMVKLYLFATTIDPVNGSPLPAGGYYSPYGYYIVFNTTNSNYESRDNIGDVAPENGEWHEFTHHLYITFVSPVNCTGQKSHGGYNNPDTCDSMQEGFAEFLPALAAQEIDGVSDSNYDSSVDLEFHNKAWGYWAGKPDNEVGYAPTMEDLAVASVYWDLVDGNADTLDSQVIAESGSHHPVTYTDLVSLPLRQLWNQLRSTSPKTVYDLRTSFGQPLLSIDLDDDSVMDVAPIDEVFLMHGFYPVELDQSIHSNHWTYHYDVGQAQRVDPSTPRNSFVGQSSHIVLDSSGEVTGFFPLRKARPYAPSANLELHVLDLSGNPVSGGIHTLTINATGTGSGTTTGAGTYDGLVTLNMGIQTPGIPESTVSRRLADGNGALVHLELPPYFDYLLPEGASLPPCDPQHDVQVHVTLTAVMNGTPSRENPSFNNCTYQQAMAVATGPAALAYTLTVPDAAPPTASVSATANPGSTFTGWTGPDAAECATGTVVMDSSKRCTATFALITYSMTLTTAGTGSGAVSGGGDYGAGQTATVSATPNTGSTFSGWSGPNASECATGSVLMNGDKNCTATFALTTHTLILLTSPGGTGTVSGGGTYGYGQTIPVSANPFPGYTFAGWTGPNGTECATGSVLINANKSCTANFVVDTTPPTGTIVINNNATGTNTKSVTLSLSCTDGPSPAYCSQMQFSNSGTGWSRLQPYSTSASWTLTNGEGTKTVYVRFTDGVGNFSTSFSDQIRLDTAVPTGSIVINGNAAATNTTSVTLTLSCGDSGSGCSQMQFSNNGTTYTALEAYTTTKAWTLMVGNGSKTVYVKYQDAAGNLSTAKSDQITVDTSPPTGSIGVNGGTPYTRNTTVTLSLSCSDTSSGSGCTQMQFSNDGNTWSEPQAYGTTAAWTLTAGDEFKTVSVRFVDGAGNISGVDTDQIALDATLPTGTILINNDAASTTTRSVTLTLSCSDAGSGCSQMQFSNTGTSGWSKLQPYATTTTYTLSAGSGTKTVYVRFTDAASNVSGNASDTILLQ